MRNFLPKSSICLLQHPQLQRRGVGGVLLKQQHISCLSSAALASVQFQWLGLSRRATYLRTCEHATDDWNDTAAAATAVVIGFYGPGRRSSNEIAIVEVGHSHQESKQIVKFLVQQSKNANKHNYHSKTNNDKNDYGSNKNINNGNLKIAVLKIATKKTVVLK